MQHSRREFIKKAALVTVSVPCVGFLGNIISPFAYAVGKDTKVPEGQTAVSESDPVASAIGFKHHVKDIDYTKYPQRKKSEGKNQFCHNCSLYTRVDESWGKCQMLTSGVVSSGGWCGSWSKKE